MDCEFTVQLDDELSQGSVRLRQIRDVLKDVDRDIDCLCELAICGKGQRNLRNHRTRLAELHTQQVVQPSSGDDSLDFASYRGSGGVVVVLSDSGGAVSYGASRVVNDGKLAPQLLRCT